MRIQLQPPDSWEDFEIFALQLWKSIWADHDAQMHGRRGQPQNGVDVYGRPFHSSTWEGVQCKGKDQLTRKQVSTEELKDEAKKAEAFTPKISAFVLATTAPRDASIQAEASRLTSLPSAPFRVTVWSWDDIEDELNFRDHLIPKLYPQLAHTITADYGSGVFANKLYFYRTQPLDQSFAFLSHPELQKIFSADTRVDIRNVFFELSLNAFTHGNASKVGVDLEKDGSFELIDDGQPYDPLTAAQPPGKGVGQLFLRLFREKYADVFTLSYARTADGENVVRFSLSTEAQLRKGISARIEVSDHDALMPDRARYIARTAYIPPGQDTLELHISSMVFSPSSIYEFLGALLGRIPSGTMVRVFCGQHDMLARCLRAWIGEAEYAVPAFKGRLEIVTNT